MLAKRELSQFVRTLMCFVHSPSVIPVEYEAGASIKPVEHERTAVDDNL